MPIVYHEVSEQFHLYNEEISYIMHVMTNKQLGHIYFGLRLNDQENMRHYTRTKACSQAAHTADRWEEGLSLQYIKQEYPSYGSSDFRQPAFDIRYANGSRVSNFTYLSHTIFTGKKALVGLPATYVEDESEATTLEIVLKDSENDLILIMSYSIFEHLAVISRSVRFENKGLDTVVLERVMSLALDFPDADYEMLHLTGAWGRERFIQKRCLTQGIQSVSSTRGVSSSEHNPFVALARKNCDEDSGEVYGFSFIYSGNHLEQVEVNQDDNARIIVGIHPDYFEWPLESGDVFQSPEAVMVYSNQGYNKMSQTFHKLFRTRLARGIWRDKRRPLIINNWETTGMMFHEEQLLALAKKGKELGLELLVLDDGWFGDRNHEKAGLGDWFVKNTEKLPDGLRGLSSKLEKMGMQFGLWFEPEMVNKDSDLFREHPDWIIHVPGRFQSPSRYQHVLDFSRPEIVEHIYEQIVRVIEEANLAYMKWDMNRYITEAFSVALGPREQGMLFHKYILGVYSLYEKILNRFPQLLINSCSSGGARFDAGMLYYAPQAWASDNSDAIDRLKIQYGTSFVYPLSSIGSHVTAIPNLQNGRSTPLKTRANVAYYGTFGYEMNLVEITKEEEAEIKEQVAYYKQHSNLIQKGLFYRIRSPFDHPTTSWIVVAEDKSEALLGYYRSDFEVNIGWKYLKLKGLDPDAIYTINKNPQKYFGDELMQIGLFLDEQAWGMENIEYGSQVLYLQKVN